MFKTEVDHIMMVAFSTHLVHCVMFKTLIHPIHCWIKYFKLIENFCRCFNLITSLLTAWEILDKYAYCDLLSLDLSKSDGYSACRVNFQQIVKITERDRHNWMPIIFQLICPSANWFEIWQCRIKSSSWQRSHLLKLALIYWTNFVFTKSRSAKVGRKLLKLIQP